MEILPIVTKGAVGSIGRILENAINGLSAAPSLLRKTAELRNFAGQVTTKYSSYCRGAHGNLRILAMSKAVELRHIYTNLRVIDRISRTLNKSSDEIVDSILAGSRREDPEAEVFSAEMVAQSMPRLVILGSAGSGKSTFLRYFLLQQLAMTNSVERIPVLVQLNDMNQGDAGVRQKVADRFHECGVEFSTDLTERLLQTGKLHILLDGLDELRANRRNQIISEIKELLRSHQQCCFIITCRSSAYDFWFEDCNHFQMERFSTVEIQSFIKKWFEEESERGKEIATQILSNPRLRDLCSNPLMLTIVCVGFVSNISDNRSEIYRDAIVALLKQWDDSRSVYRDDPYKALSSKRREELLANLAARTFSENQIVFTESRAVSIVEAFLAGMPPLIKEAVGDDLSHVLRSIESQHGLIEKRSSSFWIFTHLTFHEYFTAYYLAAQHEDVRSNAVLANLGKPDWREVMLLTAALLPNADKFVVDCMALIASAFKRLPAKPHIEREIAVAHRAIDEAHLDSRTLFSSKVESKRRFRLIEQRKPFRLDQMKQIIDTFRIAITKRIEQVDFNAYWSDDAYAGMGAFAHAISDLASILVNRRVGLSRDDVRKNLWEAGVQLRVENTRFVDDLNAIFDGTNIYRLTNRQHFYLTVHCLDQCLREVESLVQQLDMRGFERYFYSVYLDQEIPIAQLTRNAISHEVSKQVRRVAAINTSRAKKLLALVAGETLADILLSPVVLTPGVRQAAIATLKHIISDDPLGDKDPPDPDEPDVGKSALTA